MNSAYQDAIKAFGRLASLPNEAVNRMVNMAAKVNPDAIPKDLTEGEDKNEDLLSVGVRQRYIRLFLKGLASALQGKAKYQALLRWVEDLLECKPLLQPYPLLALEALASELLVTLVLESGGWESVLPSSSSPSAESLASRAQSRVEGQIHLESSPLRNYLFSDASSVLGGFLANPRDWRQTDVFRKEYEFLKRNTVWPLLSISKYLLGTALSSRIGAEIERRTKDILSLLRRPFFLKEPPNSPFEIKPLVTRWLLESSHISPVSPSVVREKIEAYLLTAWPRKNVVEEAEASHAASLFAEFERLTGFFSSVAEGNYFETFPESPRRLPEASFQKRFQSLSENQEATQKNPALAAFYKDTDFLQTVKNLCTQGKTAFSAGDYAWPWLWEMAASVNESLQKEDMDLKWTLQGEIFPSESSFAALRKSAPWEPSLELQEIARRLSDQRLPLEKIVQALAVENLDSTTELLGEEAFLLQNAGLTASAKSHWSSYKPPLFRVSIEEASIKDQIPRVQLNTVEFLDMMETAGVLLDWRSLTRFWRGGWQIHASVGATKKEAEESKKNPLYRPPPHHPFFWDNKTSVWERVVFRHPPRYRGFGNTILAQAQSKVESPQAATFFLDLASPSLFDVDGNTLVVRSPMLSWFAHEEKKQNELFFLKNAVRQVSGKTLRKYYTNYPDGDGEPREYDLQVEGTQGILGTLQPDGMARRTQLTVPFILRVSRGGLSLFDPLVWVIPCALASDPWLRVAWTTRFAQAIQPTLLAGLAQMVNPLLWTPSAEKDQDSWIAGVFLFSSALASGDLERLWREGRLPSPDRNLPLIPEKLTVGRPGALEQSLFFGNGALKNASDHTEKSGRIQRFSLNLPASNQEAIQQALFPTASEKEAIKKHGWARKAQKKKEREEAARAEANKELEETQGLSEEEKSAIYGIATTGIPRVSDLQAKRLPAVPSGLMPPFGFKQGEHPGLASTESIQLGVESVYEILNILRGKGGYSLQGRNPQTSEDDAYFQGPMLWTLPSWEVQAKVFTRDNRWIPLNTQWTKGRTDRFQVQMAMFVIDRVCASHVLRERTLLDWNLQSVFSAFDVQTRDALIERVKPIAREILAKEGETTALFDLSSRASAKAGTSLPFCFDEIGGAMWKRIVSSPVLDELAREYHPLPHQPIAVEYAANAGKVLIGDEPGLGKTAEALMILECRQAYPAVIAVPRNVVTNWLAEIQWWLPHRMAETTVFTEPDVGQPPTYETFKSKYFTLDKVQQDPNLRPFEKVSVRKNWLGAKIFVVPTSMLTARQSPLSAFAGDTEGMEIKKLTPHVARLLKAYQEKDFAAYLKTMRGKALIPAPEWEGQRVKNPPDLLWLPARLEAALYVNETDPSYKNTNFAGWFTSARYRIVKTLSNAPMRRDEMAAMLEEAYKIWQAYYKIPLEDRINLELSEQASLDAMTQAQTDAEVAEAEDDEEGILDSPPKRGKAAPTVFYKIPPPVVFTSSMLWMLQLRLLPLQGVVIDEIHNLRNMDTIAFGNVLNLTERVNKQPRPTLLGLSGTLFVNNIEETADILRIMQLIDSFGGRDAFLREYGSAGFTSLKQGAAKEIAASQQRALDALNRRLRGTCFLRRTRKQMALQMPTVVRNTLCLELNDPQIQAYASTFRYFVLSLYLKVIEEVLVILEMFDPASSDYSLISEILGEIQKPDDAGWENFKDRQGERSERDEEDGEGRKKRRRRKNPDCNPPDIALGDAQIEKMLKDAIALAKEELPGYFPTPPKVVERICQEAQIKPGMRVLEPSAGGGALSDMAYDEGGRVDCIESALALRNVLSIKQNWYDKKNPNRQGDYNLLPVADFLAYRPSEGYDRIVMNPPFENGADVIHVQRAYQILKPGGRLVAILSGSRLTNTGMDYVVFRAWYEGLQARAFALEKNSFNLGKRGDPRQVYRDTTVDTMMIVIDKPADAEFLQNPRPMRDFSFDISNMDERDGGGVLIAMRDLLQHRIDALSGSRSEKAKPRIALLRRIKQTLLSLAKEPKARNPLLYFLASTWRLFRNRAKMSTEEFAARQQEIGQEMQNGSETLFAGALESIMRAPGFVKRFALISLLLSVLDQIKLPALRAFLDLKLRETQTFDRVVTDPATGKKETRHVSRPRKVVAFFQRTKPIDALVGWLESPEGRHVGYVNGKKSYRLVTGAQSAAERFAIQGEFKGDENVRLLLCTIGATREGLNFQRSDEAVFLNLAWNAMQLEQSEGRINRLGQEAPEVKMTYLVAPDTVDTLQAALVERRRMMMLASQEGGDVTTFDQIKRAVTFAGLRALGNPKEKVILLVADGPPGRVERSILTAGAFFLRAIEVQIEQTRTVAKQLAAELPQLKPLILPLESEAEGVVKWIRDYNIQNPTAPAKFLDEAADRGLRFERDRSTPPWLKEMQRLVETWRLDRESNLLVMPQGLVAAAFLRKSAQDFVVIGFERTMLTPLSLVTESESKDDRVKMLEDLLLPRLDIPGGAIDTCLSGGDLARMLGFLQPNNPQAAMEDATAASVSNAILGTLIVNLQNEANVVNQLNQQLGGELGANLREVLLRIRSAYQGLQAEVAKERTESLQQIGLSAAALEEMAEEDMARETGPTLSAEEEE